VHFAIVGAGPAGAALGYLLARASGEVTLLERQTDFAREFRGEVLMPSGLDAIRQMGLGAALDALPQSRITRGALYRGAEPLVDLAFGDDGPRAVSQPALLEMLAREAANWPGFSLERGFTVRDLVSRDGAVVGVRGDSPSGPREVRADWVIGADGRASAVRKHSALDRPRPSQSFDIVWCRLPLPPDHAQQVRFYLSEGHFAVALHAPDGRLQIGWVIQKGTFGDLRRRGVSEWIDELSRGLSPDLARHIQKHRDEVTHPFLLDVVCDHIEQWCEPGLLLLGDAAHPMSPVGAQGINIALRDALVAANHLAPLAAAPARPRALLAACQRIAAERLPEVRSIQRLQRIPPRVIFQRNAVSRFIVRRVIPALARSRVLSLLVGTGANRFFFGTTPVKLQTGVRP
jgi:2-polyprenyl-6-methoxyphenol hydroxylase-like FAD-dependent oxidoreductase